jgi:murein DD-endopeptidase MepM/ murein hydrolase activator NlpD
MKRLHLVAYVLGAILIVSEALTHRLVRVLLRYAAEPAQVTVPVDGVAPTALRSSFGEPRSGHRRHKGIDIFARRGTPVIAATAGEVIRVGHDRLGGNVVWVAGEGAKLYYYAHLDRFRPGLHAGEQVTPGRELGVVGTTGNAVGTPPHLHFGVYPASNALRAIDPAPLLRTKGRIGRRAPRAAY